MVTTLSGSLLIVREGCRYKLLAHQGIRLLVVSLDTGIFLSVVKQPMVSRDEIDGTPLTVSTNFYNQNMKSGQAEADINYSKGKLSVTQFPGNSKSSESIHTDIKKKKKVVPIYPGMTDNLLQAVILEMVFKLFDQLVTTLQSQ